VSNQFGLNRYRQISFDIQLLAEVGGLEAVALKVHEPWKKSPSGNFFLRRFLLNCNLSGGPKDGERLGDRLQGNSYILGI
jgi:hypothetical protein